MSRKIMYLVVLLALISLSWLIYDQKYFDKNSNWNEEYRQAWYRATQGSRLIPYAWFKALEQPYSDDLFSEKEYLQSFGFIDWPKDNLPIGFAIDKQNDVDFRFSKLRWYEGQSNEEAWLGFNCAACHTSQIKHKDKGSICVSGSYPNSSESKDCKAACPRFLML